MEHQRVKNIDNGFDRVRAIATPLRHHIIGSDGRQMTYASDPDSIVSRVCFATRCAYDTFRQYEAQIPSKARKRRLDVYQHERYAL